MLWGQPKKKEQEVAGRGACGWGSGLGARAPAAGSGHGMWPWRRGLETEGGEEQAGHPCFSGCLNGRGQAQTEDGRADRALLQRMRGVHAAGPGRTPETSAHVQDLYREWLDGADAPRARGTLHTAHQGPGRPADGRDIKW